jgi:hypothetical protein
MIAWLAFRGCARSLPGGNGSVLRNGGTKTMSKQRRNVFFGSVSFAGFAKSTVRMPPAEPPK